MINGYLELSEIEKEKYKAMAREEAEKKNRKQIPMQPEITVVNY